MSAPFRIKRPDADAKSAAAAGAEGFNSYLDRLLKMIPGEVVSLYLVGSSLIPEDLYDTDRGIALSVWGLLCLLGVVIIRTYGTADLPRKLPPDWTHVGISTVAFIIWVYSMGGPFQEFKLYVPYLGALLVLTWTFFLPMVYKGPED
jgi:hypothetical protein